MKRLKIWSRKKRKKKAYNYLPYYPPPPPPSRPPPPPPLPQINHHSCCSCSRAEPSAPPLPQSLWITSEEEAILAAQVVQPAAPEFDYAAMPDDEISNSSYQQYMVPDPVYGIPVSTRNAKTERSGGLFGCVLDFGIHLIRCFIPCYLIKEVK
ncbi:hypothetical protein L484_010969 [Morus notabilis]|uniref:Uncharacterized protein n=2 Tax=Morus notabilis TaxID=981085 RepID=W9RB32_9ROSA|nr:hypothetical protein L484_010969 [Morus notabilis]